MPDLLTAGNTLHVFAHDVFRRQLNEQPRTRNRNSEQADNDVIHFAYYWKEVKIEGIDKVKDGEHYGENLEQHENRFPIDRNTAIPKQPPSQLDKIWQVIEEAQKTERFGSSAAHEREIHS